MICTNGFRWIGYVALGFALSSCAAGMGRPPVGAEGLPTGEESAAISRLRSRVDGWVVWSSSRLGNHDLFAMKTDGSGLRRLTQGDEVDWFPRFSPDGRQVLFTRSKRGWVSEQDANRPEKWDLYLVPFEGGAPKRAVEGASWGTWIDAGHILFARGTRVLKRNLAQGEEELLLDSTQSGLEGAELQNPNLSPDGKYLAITLRGSRRETGVFNLASRTWTKTGEGCQVNWVLPRSDRILWVNQSGNGGSEVLSRAMRDGRPADEPSLEQMRLIDLPGRRSHEYFPQLDRTGRFLVWAATQRGHDHDIADYEIYLWQVGSAPAEAARLTFHSANDRWPDVFLTR